MFFERGGARHLRWQVSDVLADSAEVRRARKQVGGCRQEISRKHFNNVASSNTSRLYMNAEHAD